MPSRRVLVSTWLKSNPFLRGKYSNSWVLTLPRSPALFPAKNSVLKKAWSPVKIKSWDEETSFLFTRLPICADTAARSEIKKGSAWEGSTLDSNCSILTAAKYSLTSLDAAGFPYPGKDESSPPLPAAENIERSFPIRESTVTKANRFGQVQSPPLLLPNKRHISRWILVFQIRKLTTSSGIAQEISRLGVNRLKKPVSSFSRLDFCLV